MTTRASVKVHSCSRFKHSCENGQVTIRCIGLLFSLPLVEVSLRSSERNRCRCEYIVAAMPLDQCLHYTTHRFRVDMTIDMDDRTLARICLRFARVSSLSALRYIEDGQHFETATAERLIVDKIPAPNRA